MLAMPDSGNSVVESVAATSGLERTGLGKSSSEWWSSAVSEASVFSANSGTQSHAPQQPSQGRGRGGGQQNGAPSRVFALSQPSISVEGEGSNAVVEGGENESAYNGKVISVKWSEITKRIGIDGSSKAIKEAIRSAFGLRTKRTFWLEDDNGVIHKFKDMPLRNYNLHLDKGLAIKICLYNELNSMHAHTEEKTFYNEDNFCGFLNSRGWISLKDISCIKYIDTAEQLHLGKMFHVFRMLG